MQKAMVITALQYGAKHYILKPYSPEKLLEAVFLVLDNVRRSRSKSK
ncbi:MAG: response regulator [Syntrophomonadaceae bacterium]|nr:response regulator [Syntrophomonadaceae bacterium]